MGQHVEQRQCVCEYTTVLWSAGISVPIDQGSRDETATGRKIRPITLLEVLVKFAESLLLDFFLFFLFFFRLLISGRPMVDFASKL